MRIDLFLPFNRKLKPGVVRKPAGLIVRAMLCIVPRRLRSVPGSGKPGLARRWLKRLGATWLLSPVRRVVQAVCLLAFLAMFMYVAFPYTARPAGNWPGWLPVGVDVESGVVTLEPQSGTSPSRPRDGAAVYLAEVSSTAKPPDQAAGKPPPPFGRFVISTAADKRLTLAPTQKLAEEDIGRMSFSVGPWTMHEHPPDAWPSHYADDLAAKEKVSAETFLIIDPLVSISTALAARAWVWSLVWAGVILVICVFVPRGFCGYLCPLGTLIDLFDWAIGKRVTRFRVADDGWWVHIKYYVLLGVLVAAMFGVLLSGFVSAIPVITRGLLFTLKPAQDGMTRGWHNVVPPIHAGQIISIVLFVAVLAMGLWKPRFWCKYVCPSGAVFSLGNLFRATERKVESTCIHCNKCVEVCPFDAIKPDFTTRTTDCTLCQTCGGACPVDAIKFVGRGNRIELKILNDPPTGETPIGRRGFLAAGVGLCAAVAGGIGASTGVKALGANLADPSAPRPVRPPGSVPEQEFLQLCIRCGECFRACPNDVLQPLGFRQGIEGLWTPYAEPDWAGCEPSCNACGQVCPTGAIRALPLIEKRAARMGLAIVDQATCLPFAGREACQLCVDECDAAGYRAIEFVRAGTKADEDGNPIEDSGFLAPVVRADLCVGCGLCQTRCYAINKQEKKLLTRSAIVVEAGPGKEDRMMRGSYVALRVKGRAV